MWAGSAASTAAMPVSMNAAAASPTAAVAAASACSARRLSTPLVRCWVDMVCTDRNMVLARHVLPVNTHNTRVVASAAAAKSRHGSNRAHTPVPAHASAMAA